MNDKDNPPSMEELKELNKTIEDKMPDIVKTYAHKEMSVKNTANSSSNSVAHELVEKTNLNEPNIDKAFDLARVDIPDFGTKPEHESTPEKTLG